MNKKLIIGIIALLLILTSGGYVAKKYFDGKNPAASSLPSSEVKTNETLYADYLNEAIEYRTAGFQGDTEAFYKAIDSYKKAAEVFKGEKKAWVPYLNIGNTYRLVEEYENAEDAYDKALEITAGESMIYLAKIEMYRYEMKKSDAEIGKVYEDALKVVMDNANLVISYAAFLRDVGKYEEAIKYYQILLERYPDKQAYKEEIEFLRSKL